jgi:antitoxin MazE
MRTTLVRIGNAYGIRIPQPLLHARGLTGQVELTVEDGRLVVAPATHPRAGWEESFAAAPPTEEDRAIGVTSRLDDEEWTW